MSTSRVQPDVVQSEVVVPSAANKKPMHRIAAVREEQGISTRRICKLLSIDPATLRAHEDERSDLKLSDLYRWQRALGVPVADLLVDSELPLSAPVLTRAKLVRVMKTATAMMEKCRGPAMERLGQTLIDQLVDLMPELRDVGPWNAVGQRRSQQEFGRIAERPYPDNPAR